MKCHPEFLSLSAEGFYLGGIRWILGQVHSDVSLCRIDSEIALTFTLSSPLICSLASTQIVMAARS